MRIGTLRIAHLEEKRARGGDRVRACIGVGNARQRALVGRFGGRTRELQAAAGGIVGHSQRPGSAYEQLLGVGNLPVLYLHRGRDEVGVVRIRNGERRRDDRTAEVFREGDCGSHAGRAAVEVQRGRVIDARNGDVDASNVREVEAVANRVVVAVHPFLACLQRVEARCSGECNHAGGKVGYCRARNWLSAHAHKLDFVARRTRKHILRHELVLVDGERVIRGRNLLGNDDLHRFNALRRILVIVVDKDAHCVRARCDVDMRRSDCSGCGHTGAAIDDGGGRHRSGRVGRLTPVGPVAEGLRQRRARKAGVAKGLAYSQRFAHAHNVGSARDCGRLRDSETGAIREDVGYCHILTCVARLAVAVRNLHSDGVHVISIVVCIRVGEIACAALMGVLRHIDRPTRLTIAPRNVNCMRVEHVGVSVGDRQGH